MIVARLENNPDQVPIPSTCSLMQAHINTDNEDGQTCDIGLEEGHIQ